MLPENQGKTTTYILIAGVHGGGIEQCSLALSSSFLAQKGLTKGKKVTRRQLRPGISALHRQALILILWWFSKGTFTAVSASVTEPSSDRSATSATVRDEKSR